MNYSGIYRIVHIATGREYIGQSVNIAKRWNTHRRRLNAGDHHAPHLMAAWAKYGEDAFVFEIVEFCDVSCLDAAEQAYLDERRPAFNTATFARTRRGVPHSPETKAKLSASLKGRIRPPEERAAIAAANLGKRHTDASKAKMSDAAKGRKASDEARAAMSVAQKGRKRPASEYDGRRGLLRPIEAIERSAAARRGQKRTPEQIERMRDAARRMSPEKRDAIAEARREAIRQRMATR